MFDIIIATCNRPQNINSLVDQILSLNSGLKKLIVVDSSDEFNEKLFNNTKVKYLKSTYKAQPYQRYVGLLSSESEYIVFLDDDLEILFHSVFTDIINVFNQNENIVGVTAKVDYKSGLFVQDTLKSYSRYLGKLKPFLEKISLNYTPQYGRISINGNGGGYPLTSSFVDYFPGPNMAFKREVALNLFDENLFEAYSMKIGKGEDKYLSMKANLYGDLYCLANKYYFNHPPIESSYNSGLREFQTKQSFSRYMLMKQYMNVFYNLNQFTIFVYLWYSSFRLLGSLNNFERFKGIIQGIKLVFKYCIRPKKIFQDISFFDIAINDSKNNKS
jgi:glycosyltransferase involved in cell wall biosynthesis